MGRVVKRSKKGRGARRGEERGRKKAE